MCDSVTTRLPGLEVARKKGTRRRSASLLGAVTGDLFSRWRRTGVVQCSSQQCSSGVLSRP